MNLYKYVTWIFVAVVLIPLGLHAQLTVNLHQPPPNQLTMQHLWWADINNPTKNTYSVYLHGEVTEARKGLVAQANSNSFPLPPGMKRIQKGDITGVNDTWYQRDIEEILVRTGSFPAGDYTVCISVIDAKTKIELGHDCIHQQIAGVGQLRLLAPQNGQALADKSPLFSWLPPTSLPPGAAYKLKLVEILNKQTKEDAMRLNPALLLRDGIITSQFRYPTETQPLETGKRYAWQVEVSFGKPAATVASEIWEISTSNLTPQVTEKACLSVKRQVERHCNWFEVTLSLANTCSFDISNIVVSDSNLGFQCLNEATQEFVGEFPVPCSVRTNDDGTASSITIDLSTLDITPGTTILLHYYVVPILYDSYSYPVYAPDYAIGEKLKIIYVQQNETKILTPKKKVAPVPELNQAFSCADYLIVTAPFHLHTNFPGQQNQIDHLLPTMAKLAKERKGVLGYLGMMCNAPALIRTLIVPGGDWSKKLCPGWTQSGYLLLVGEKNIVPHWLVTNPVPNKEDIVLCDNLYADISGDARPELRIGRIIGAGPNELRTLIERSLEVLSHQAENNGSDAFLVSGKPHADESATLFSTPVNSGAAYSHDVKDATTTVYHNVPGAANADSVRKRLKNKDFIVICSHGGPSGLSGVLSAGDLTSGDILSGSTRPVVFAVACHTAVYNDPSGSIARSFLNNGAAVYMGATVMTNTGDPGEQIGGNHRFLQYWNKGERIGDVYRAWKIDLVASPPASCALRLLYAFNFYGDPKFGGD